MRDLKYALRSLNKSPGFVAVATLCLGLALALNTTTYAILDAMLRPNLDADELRRLREELHSSRISEREEHKNLRAQDI